MSPEGSMRARPVGPPDFSVRPRFASPPTFAGLPRADQVSDLDVGIVGLPFDSGTSYRPGARFGPAHIRQSSRLLRPYNPDLDVEPFAAQQVADLGDLALTPFNIAEAVAAMERAADELLERAGRLLALGGDHTVVLPLLRAVKKKLGPVAVLHFDAHLDTWGSYFGAPIHHGSPFRRASEEGLLDLEGCVHVGTRSSIYRPEDLGEDARLGFQVIRCETVEVEGLGSAIEAAKRRLGDRPVYLSVDIDVLDPAFAPGTGTPEAGGLTSRELLSFLRRLRGINLVGADVVEVSPAYDHAEVTGIAAAHVAYELLSLWATGTA